MLWFCDVGINPFRPFKFNYFANVAALEMRRKVDVMYDDIIDGRGGVVLFIFYGRIESLMECVRVFAVFK